MPRNIFLILIFVCAGTQIMTASNMGAEISYTYLGGTKYLINVNIYSDCGNGNPGQPTIQILDGTKKNYLYSTYCCKKDITPVGQSCTLCTDAGCGLHFGVSKITYTVQADMSKYSSCNLVINAQSVYLDTSTNTTRPPTYFNFTVVECMLNRCHGDHDSPSFQSDPVTLLCNKQAVNTFQYANPGNSGDSLVHKTIAIKNGYGGYIGYNNPFTKDVPLSYTGASDTSAIPDGFHYNAITGALNFKPKKIESSFISFQAVEYTKDSSGVYYVCGTAQRTCLVNIIDCSADNPPVISGINKTPSDTLYTCSNIPISFNIYSSDTDKNDVVVESVQNNTGGTFTTSSGPKPVITFKWTPKNKDVGTGAHFFTVNAQDKASPVPGQSTRRFYIFVKDSLPVTAIQLTDSGCGRFHLALDPLPDKNYNLSYTWLYDNVFISAKPDFSYKNNLAGKHYISLGISNIKSGCTEYLLDSVYYDTAYQRLTPQTAICKGDVVPLHAAKGKNLIWSPTTGLSDVSIANPIAKPDATTTYTISATDAKGCTYTDQQKITVSDFKIIKSQDKTICNGDQVKLYINHVNGSTVQWLPAGTLNKGAGDTLIATPHQTTFFKAYVNLNGCIKTDSIKVNVNPTHSQSENKMVCGDDSVKLFAKGGTSYKWYDERHMKFILGTDSFYNFKAPNYSNIYYIPLEVIMTDRKTGCLDTNQIIVLITSFNPTWTKKSGDICKGEVLTYAASGGDAYSWTLPGTGTSAYSEITFKPVATTKLLLTITKNTVCSKTDTITVFIPPTPANYPPITICKGDTAYLSAKGGSQYVWGPTNSGLKNIYAQNQTIIPKASTKYTVTIKDSAVGCVRTDTQMVILKTDCVWPGDANKDKTADYLDVLNIGVGYGSKGPARAKNAIFWKQYPVDDWNDTLANGTNFKHFDCNGDGIIDARDTAIISNNYGKKHNKWSAGTGNPTDPPIYFKFVKDTFYAGDTAVAYLYAGKTGNPLKNTYGVGYEANYTGSPLIANTGNVSPFCDYFCNGTELNYMRPDYINNNVRGVTVETNGNTVKNTTGKIAVLKFRLQDSFSHAYNPKGEKIYARLLSATAINNTGKELNIYGLNDSAIVLGSKHKKNGIDISVSIPGLKIYPNPANNQLIVESGSTLLKKITIYNSVGQSILEMDNISGIKTIDVSCLIAGMYFIEMKTDTMTERQKLLIQR
jgi:hypothetical protein